VKYSWTICDVKEHYQIFEKSAVFIRDCLLLIIRLNVDIIKILTDIKLGKVTGLLKLSNQLRDQ